MVAVAGHAAGDVDARVLLRLRQAEIRVALVVAQQHVVPGRALLDDVVLERQGLHDRVGDDHLEPVGLVQQRVGLGVGPVGAEVAADAVPQRPRLADVDRLAGAVAVHVDARLLGQPGDLGLQIVDGHCGAGPGARLDRL